MEKFCQEAGITLPELLELNIQSNERRSLTTFSDFLQDILDIRNIGLPLSVRFSSDDGDITGEFSFKNPQMATLASSLQKDIELYESGRLTDEEFEVRMGNLLRMFDIPIADYVR